MAMLDQQRPRRVAREHRPKPWLRPDRDPVRRERLPAELDKTRVMTEMAMGEQDPVDGRVVDRPRCQVIEKAQLLTDRRRGVDEPTAPIGTNEGEACRRHDLGLTIGAARTTTTDLRPTTVLADTEHDRLGHPSPTCDRPSRHSRTVTGRTPVLGNVHPVNDSPPVVYGAEWCKDCRRSKQLLKRLNVEHIDVDLEAEPDRATEAEELSGRKRIPVVHFADGLVLSEPSDDELERAVRERGLVPEGS